MNNTDAPLFAACSTATSVVRLLIEHGADIHTNNNRMSPLYAACTNAHVDVARLLIEHDADVSQAAKTARRRCWALRRCHCSLTRRGHAEIVRLLLRGGADIWQTNDSGVSPLSLARERSAAGNAPYRSSAMVLSWALLLATRPKLPTWQATERAAFTPRQPRKPPRVLDGGG